MRSATTHPVTSLGTRSIVIVSMLWLVGCAQDHSVGMQSETPPPPAAQPTPSPAWVTFTSDRYGYSIGHPDDWRVVEHTGRPNLSGMRVGSSGTDSIGSRDAFVYNSDDGVVVVSAHELEESESLADFSHRVSREAACGSDGFGREDTRLDGEPAEYRRFVCGDFDWVQVTTLHGERGYVIWAAATVAPPAHERPINDELLRTFQFTD